jgi:hypothetical protein
MNYPKQAREIHCDGSGSMIATRNGGWLFLHNTDILSVLSPVYTGDEFSATG